MQRIGIRHGEYSYVAMTTGALVVACALMFAGCDDGGGSSGGGGTTANWLVRILDFSPEVDLSVVESDPDTNLEGESLILADPDSPDGEARIYVRYDIAWIACPCKVLSAELLLEDLSGGSSSSDLPLIFSVHEVLSPWSSDTISWNDQPAYDPDPLYEGSIEDEDFDLAIPIPISLVEDWIFPYSASNYGLVLIPEPSFENAKTLPSVEDDGVGVVLQLNYPLLAE